MDANDEEKEWKVFILMLFCNMLVSVKSLFPVVVSKLFNQNYRSCPTC